MEQNVARFDISVHNVRSGQQLEGLEQVTEVSESLAFIEPALRLDLLLESASVAILVDEVVVVGSFQDLNEPHNVCRILNLGQSLNLIDSELLQLGTHLELLDLYDLDSHQLVGLLVEGLVDFSELSLSHHSVQDVVLDLLAHRR